MYADADEWVPEGASPASQNPPTLGHYLGQGLAGLAEGLTFLPDLALSGGHWALNNLRGNDTDFRMFGQELINQLAGDPQTKGASALRHISAFAAPGGLVRGALKGGASAAFKGAGKRALTGGIIGAGGEALRALGAPEPLAMAAEIAASLGHGSLRGKKKPDLTPEGRQKLNYEVTTPGRKTPVSQEAYEDVVHSVKENNLADLERLAHKAEKSLGPMTPVELDSLEKSWAAFGEKVKQSPAKVPASDLREGWLKRLSDRVEKHGKIAKTEEQSSYEKTMNSYLKGETLDNPNATIAQYEQLYRDINKERGKFYSPSNSPSSNAGHKKALDDLNAELGNFLEKNLPGELGSEFRALNKLEQNKYAREYAGNTLIPELLNGDKKSSRSYLSSKNRQDELKRYLGEEGEKEFRGIISRIESTPHPSETLRVADAAKVFGSPTQLALASALYFVHPLASGAKIAQGVYKYGKQKLLEKNLLKPAFRRDYATFLDAMKSKKWGVARRTIASLNRQMENSSEESDEEWVPS